jgi:hypothetical protein
MPNRSSTTPCFLRGISLRKQNYSEEERQILQERVFNNKDITDIQDAKSISLARNAKILATILRLQVTQSHKRYDDEYQEIKSYRKRRTERIV